MTHTEATLKIIVTRLNESQDILERLHASALNKPDFTSARRIYKQMQKIGTSILDYEWQLKQKTL